MDINVNDWHYRIALFLVCVLSLNVSFAQDFPKVGETWTGSKPYKGIYAPPPVGLTDAVDFEVDGIAFKGGLWKENELVYITTMDPNFKINDKAYMNTKLGDFSNKDKLKLYQGWGHYLPIDNEWFAGFDYNPINDSSSVLFVFKHRFATEEESRLAEKENPRAVKVEYDIPGKINHEVAFVINGVFIPELHIGSLDVQMIAGVKVLKGDTVLNGKKFNSMLQVDMKDGYKPSFITLNALRQKYTSIPAGQTIFMINDQIINGNQDNLQVDEKHILKISVTSVESVDPNTNVHILKLLTNTTDNLRRSNDIMLRSNPGLGT